MSQTGIRWSATGTVVALVAALAGCGDAEAEPPGIVRTSACAVSAPAGFQDAGVGAAVLGQIRDAAGQGGVDTTSAQRVSTAAQTQAALERYAAEACTLTALIGPGGSGALAQVAADNPDRAFLAVGAGVDIELPDNVLTVDFDLREAAFLAGFTAASATRTGTVAVSVAAGQYAGEELLTAFDEGVRARADQLDGEVAVVEAGATAPRTLEDTVAAGQDWADAAIAADADVLVPFGSASPQGVADRIGTLAEEEEADDEDATDDVGGAKDAADDTDGAAHGGAEDLSGPADGGAADGGAADGEPEGASAEESELPVLIWYGSDGSKTLPRPVRHQVIASIDPDVGLGMRAVLTGWPGDGGDPEELVQWADADGDGGEDAVPELVGGLEVRARAAVGDLDNGGVDVVASDGVLGSITGLGRTIADGKELLDDAGDEDDG
nr:BMP family ABC transporter substrate-binding protein [Brevibacterium yomogidense]